MLMLHSCEGKNKELVLENIIRENNISQEDLFYNVKEDKTALFLGKKYLISYITKEEIINYINEFIKELDDNMQLNIISEIFINDDLINILLNCNRNDILIGKEGKTLNALQVIFRNILSSLMIFDLKISVDVANYRKKQIENLQKEIKKICKELLLTKASVKLDSMNSYERRIVHSIVSQYANLSSHSEGEEPNRFTIINYKD